MPADLRIALPGSGVLFQIHPLEDDILSILFLQLQNSLLHILLPFQSRFFFCMLSLQFRIVSKYVQLLTGNGILFCFALIHNLARSQIDPAHQQIGIHDPVVQRS